MVGYTTDGALSLVLGFHSGISLNSASYDIFSPFVRLTDQKPNALDSLYAIVTFDNPKVYGSDMNEDRGQSSHGTTTLIVEATTQRRVVGTNV